MPFLHAAGHSATERKRKMKILDININDFGGTDNHREEFKELYGNRRYLKEWDHLDKSKEIKGILDCIERHLPDIVVMQEYDINSEEAKFFEKEMESRGYVLKSEKAVHKRPSMTVFYLKEEFVPAPAYVSTGHTRNGRAYAIKADGLIIYGTHVPPVYDEQFWEELHSFAEKYMPEKYLLIGDFNTINGRNRNEFENLLDHSTDVWEAKGNKEPISVMGDHAIISKAIKLDNVDIELFDERNTDHPVIIVSIE